MADDKNKTRPQDSKRVNIKETYEVQYWSEKFNTSPEKLREAVGKVGVMAADVERELQGSEGGVGSRGGNRGGGKL